MRSKLNYICGIVIAGAVILITGCGKNQEQEKSAVTPKADVEVTTIDKANLNDTIFMTAGSFYNSRSVVVSPISGYITEVTIANGENISSGKFIFEIVTKEYNALKSSRDILDSLNIGKKAGKIEINSPAGGQVSDLTVLSGQYVQEGSALCSIIDMSSLLFKLYVPLQFHSDISTGKRCTIQMPDGKLIDAVVSNLSAKTEQNTQTEVYFLRPVSAMKVPEGINVKVFIVKRKPAGSQVLPKQAVLSSEKLDEYWVMKLINDSTAIKVPVVIGNIYGGIIEIKEPQFSPDEKIITSGNYGLPDTALVHIIAKTDEK